MAGRDIKTDGYCLSDLLGGKIWYEVGPFQREYTWGADEVRTLVADLAGAFLGWYDCETVVRRLVPV